MVLREVEMLQAKRKKSTKSSHVRFSQHFFLPPTNENHSKGRSAANNLMHFAIDREIICFFALLGRKRKYIK
jgi:hypothetical protein